MDELINEVNEMVNSLGRESVAEGIYFLSKNGIVPDSEFPFSRVVYENAAEKLCKKLESFGYSGKLVCVGQFIADYGNSYAVYDSHFYDRDQALKWLINFHVAKEW